MTRKSSLLPLALLLLGAVPAGACGTFPAGVGSDDLIIEFKADGTGKTKTVKRSAAGTPREGMLLFDSSDGTLKFCNGTSWIPAQTTSPVTTSYVAVWGDNAQSQLGNSEAAAAANPTPMRLNSLDTSLYQWSKIETGDDFTCGLRSGDGRIFCWGTGGSGQLGIGSTVFTATTLAGLTPTGGWDATSWKTISAGGTSACAIRASDDRIFCWGVNSNGQLGTGNTSQQNSPAALNSTGGWDVTAWKTVSAGTSHTCAIRSSDDRMFCWGLNSSGQLGIGSTTQQTSPTALDSTGGWDVTAWKTVSVGLSHTCAIRSSDDRMFCWGLNSNGQLGIGSTTQQTSPTALNSTGGWDVTAWKTVSGAQSHTCAIRLSDDRIFCWGDNSSAQMGTGSSSTSPIQLQSSGGWNTTAWKAVTARKVHTCAIRASDNRLFCWGLGLNGKLGTGDSTDRTSPTALSATDGWNATAWASASVGGQHSCAIRTSDNRVFCWGANSNGQLGTGDTSSQSIPTSLLSTGGWNTASWKAISTGLTHSCAIRAADDRMFCWGDNANYQLGTNSTAKMTTPAQLTTSSSWNTASWSSVSLGSSFSCAIRLSDSLMFCWGLGGNGQLANGGTSSQGIPGSLAAAGGWNATAWKTVSTGASHGCAVRASDDRIFCWGLNTNGRLGTGNTTQQTSPVALNSTGGWDVTAWKTVAAGGSHTCAIRASDDRIFCWGLNTNGQLGTGNTTQQTSPAALNSTGGWNTTAWKMVSAGTSHTCAIRASDDRIFCWGLNTNGRLGTGNTTQQTSPAALNSTGGWDVTAWKTVAAGGSSSCAIRTSDGQVFCWGLNTSGQLGTGDTTQQLNPTALDSTGGWNTKSWKSLSAGNVHIGAIESDINECPSFSSAFDPADLVIQPVAVLGKTKWGAQSRFTQASSGALAYDATNKQVRLCATNLWKIVTTATGASCASYPGGVSLQDRVIEWRRDGSRLFGSSNITARPSPREGTMIYDAGSKTLQICDGINWQILQ